MADPVDRSQFDRLMAAAEQAYEEQLREIGKFNLAVFGDTGVGKSSLINAIFGVRVAETGRGAAQTVEIARRIRTPDDPLTIYDNVGFVTGDGSVEELINRISGIVGELRAGPAEGHIHVVWFVHNVLTNRFTEQHEQIVRAVHRFGLPVMLVLTHVARRDDEISDAATALSEHIAGLDLPLAAGGRIFLVNSVEMPQLGGPALPPHGLTELLQATMDLVPDAARAIGAVQRLDFSMQRREAVKVLRNHRRAAVGAGSAAGVPLPGIDVLGLGAIMSSMLARISAVYALPIGKKQLLKVTTVAVIGAGGVHAGAAQGTRAAGRWFQRRAARKLAERGAVVIAAETGKQAGRFVPVLNVAVGVVSAVSAAGLTSAAGHAWMRACEHLLNRPQSMRSVDETDLLNLFQSFYQRRGSAPPEE